MNYLTDGKERKVIYDIIIRFEHPPIPDRSFDYSASRSSYDEGDPIGRGPTPIAALADLLEQEMDREERSRELVETIKGICIAGWEGARRG
jgi:hypothetical protein